MPTYEYKCEACGHRFDVFHKISEHPELECPKCKGKVSRMPSVGSVGGSNSPGSCLPSGGL